MGKQRSPKRRIFAELMEGLSAIGERREGNVALQTHSVAVGTIKDSSRTEDLVTPKEGK
jgi:hypothetical protein